ncbi:MAG: low molecular weight phosphotyrosine protein phosphatase [Thiomargarita sp.]|nr:low molecular weight phosphotyrosine protein phosphatase [Thiomargarita sp.]
MIKILFVCMGNICRSPTAEGVFRDLVKKENLSEHFLIDSAGTHAYHVGSPPAERSQDTAHTHGIDLSGLRARQVTMENFREFDYIIAMDEENYRQLYSGSPRKHVEKIHLFLDFAPEQNEKSVPDPYYGTDNGFEHVFDLIKAASRGLLAECRKSL